MTDEEIREILLSDKYHCTELVQPREVRPGRWFPPVARRCSVVGSEMVVRDGRAMCPLHAARYDEAHGA